jgi:DNA-binding LacI/PurR family transcriptional regulator
MITRETRFLAAAAEASAGVTLIRPGSASYQTGVLAARELLNQPLPPDGVFCVTDLIACGFIDAARHEFGLRIPEDIRVIGFDDIDQASWLGYQLTTFAQPLAEMAEAACEMLLAADAEKPASRVFRATLVKRGTTGPAGYGAA